MRLLAPAVVIVASCLIGNATSLVAAPNSKISQLNSLPQGFDIAKLSKGSKVLIINDGPQQHAIKVNGSTLGSLLKGNHFLLIGLIDGVELEAIQEGISFFGTCSSSTRRISANVSQTKIVRIANLERGCSPGNVKIQDSDINDDRQLGYTHMSWSSRGPFSNTFLVGFNSIDELVRLEAEYAQQKEADLAKERQVTAEKDRRALEQKFAKQEKEREREAVERAPLSRGQFVALHTELQGLLKRRDFEAAEVRFAQSCVEMKFNTAECQYLWGLILAAKASTTKIAKDKEELIGDARGRLQVAFNFSVQHSDDNADVETLAAVALLPLLGGKREDLVLEKELLEHLQKSEFSSSQQKALATKRLTKIEGSMHAIVQAEERAERAKEQAEKLSEKREEAERQRQQKIEMARQDAEARRGDGTPDDLRCKGLGLRPATPTYIRCRDEFSRKAEGERIAQDQDRQRLARQEQDQRKNEEVAMRGDGTSDHQSCYRYGFKPGTSPYAECRQRLDMARKEAQQKQAAFEIEQTRYMDQLTAYQKEQDIQRGVRLLELSSRMAGGQSFGSAAAGIAPIAPQRPSIENNTIIMPGGRIVNCTYVPSMRNMNCF